MLGLAPQTEVMGKSFTSPGSASQQSVLWLFGFSAPRRKHHFKITLEALRSVTDGKNKALPTGTTLETLFIKGLYTS